MRSLGLFALVVTLVGGGVLSAAGCSRSAVGGPGKGVWAQPSDPVPVSASPVPSAAQPSSGPPPTGGSRSPAPTRTGTAASGWPPWCRLADLRFATRAGTGSGWQVSGSVLLTNVSGQRCSLGIYLILRWRDANGAVLPVTVKHVNGPVPPPVIFVIQPGSTAFAGLYWNRYQSLNSTATCPPFPATLDLWLPATGDNPHPERGPATQVAWVTGDNASVCGGTVELRPLDRLP